MTEHAAHTRLSHMISHVSGVSSLECFEEEEGSAEGTWD